MIERFERYKNVIAITVVVGLAFVAYSLLFQNGEEDALVASKPEEGGAVVERELVSLLLTLRSIELDGSLFEDPAFFALEDFGQDIAPEPVGRRNPFAPLGTDALPAPVIQEERSE